ncbi:MAG: ABC-2 family transporter protein [Bacilli bacterium]|nr:ABC-2 family transporter protein [Bacilli bacterium]
MKSYITYFKLKFKTGLQYRAAALAGMATQVFFGFVYVSIYIAFYESGSGNLPMELNELVSYVWISQSLLALVYMWYKDKEILNMIKSGNIAYELCRPQDLYFMWASKILGERLSSCALRFLPVILFALLLPSPYNLDLSITLPRLLLFMVVMILSIILMTVLVLLYHVICLITLDDKGIVNIFMVLSDILSGMAIPIPFFPSYLKNISNILPFRYITDFPFRLYVGNISINEGLFGLVIQIIWIIILVIIGRFITKKSLKKAVIQGG